MAKASYFGMRLHQWLGFSHLMLKVPRTEAIFWPGCALLNLDGEILEKTLAVLGRAEPEINLACGCCGQPTVYLFPEQAEKRQKRLVSLLKKQKVYYKSQFVSKIAVWYDFIRKNISEKIRNYRRN